MSYLDNNSHLIAISDTATTLAGILFWTVLMAAYLALILFTLRKIIHSSLSTPARTRWAWLVVLAPLLGIVLWFLAGRPAAARQRPSTDQA
jgi:H+/Cl- antiporter ClcA